MAGIEQQIGIGQAQITPNGSVNAMQVAQQINSNYERKIQLDYQKQLHDQQRQRQIIGLVGEALDPRIFDKVFTEKVVSAQKGVLKKIQENPNLSEADVAVMAQGEAQKIAQLNDLFQKNTKQY